MFRRKDLLKGFIHLLLFIVLLAGSPVRVAAISNEAKVLFQRQVELFNTDSTETFLNVSKQLRAQLEEEGEVEWMYRAWANQVGYFLDNVSSKQALEMADEMKEHAVLHNNKSGFYLATLSNAFIASQMGLTDRTEELLLQSIAYRKRHLPNERPSTQVYQLLVEIYTQRKQLREAIRVVDEALRLTTWRDRDRVYLLYLKCGACFEMEPADTANFMKCYQQMYALVPTSPNHDDFSFLAYIDCLHARLTNDYPRLLKLAQSLTMPIAKYENEYIAYEGMGRYEEALEAHKELKQWQDSLQNAETRKLTEMNALELQAARAENEANTLRLNNQRMLLIAIVCGLLLIGAFLVIYLRRRQKQMRQLKQAYDQLEEVTTQKERIESELRIARDIQMSMVPGVFPQHEGLDMYASMTPAKEVGGDLYGYVLQGDLLYFCVGDVSGKGVPASLFMAQSAQLFRTLATEGMIPTDIAFRMNNELSEGNDRNMFVTMFIGLLHLDTGRLDYCNCGHNPPVLVDDRQASAFLEIKHVNQPLGLMEGIPFVGDTVSDIRGRQLLIYTDGLNEAENRQYEQFGDKRLLELMACNLNSHEVVEMLKKAVDQHRNGAEPNDDLTLMCLKLSR